MRIAAAACLLAFTCTATEPAADLGRAVDEIARGARSADGLEIRVEWLREGELVPAKVFGRGVGVWRGRTQVAVAKTDVEALAGAVSRSGFASMPDTLGEEETDLLTLRGKLTVRVDGIAKTVVQLQGGKQWQELASLAERVMTTAEAGAAKGISVSALADALGKLASGALAPEMLELVAQHRPETSSSRAPGYMLRLSGREAEARPFAKGGYGAAKRLTLNEADVRQIVEALRSADLPGLPQSLYADDYVELRVQVLDQAKDVTARRALAVTKETHGPRQKAFERLDAALSRLAERVLSKGVAETQAGPGA